MTTASLLIVLIAGTAVGAIVGLALGGGIDLWYLALLAGFLGSTIAVLVRNFILARGAGLGPDDSRTPVVVMVFAAVASLGAGSLALEVAEHSGLGDSSVWIGTLAGLFASILLAMLMVTYHTRRARRRGSAPSKRSGRPLPEGQLLRSARDRRQCRYWPW
jgi:tellurite resistance protein TehA-like permease